MRHGEDIVMPRQTLTAVRAVAAAVHGLAPVAESRADLWRLMVDNFAVDLDALATVLPRDESEAARPERRA